MIITLNDVNCYTRLTGLHKSWARKAQASNSSTRWMKSINIATIFTLIAHEMTNETEWCSIDWFIVTKCNGMIGSVWGMHCGWQLFVVIRHYYQRQLSDVSWFAYEFRPRAHLRCIIKMMEIRFSSFLWFQYRVLLFLPSRFIFSFCFISMIVMIKETIYSYYALVSDAFLKCFGVLNSKCWVNDNRIGLVNIQLNEVAGVWTVNWFHQPESIDWFIIWKRWWTTIIFYFKRRSL